VKPETISFFQFEQFGILTVAALMDA
jgi:hypothetical protein